MKGKNNKAKVKNTHQSVVRLAEHWERTCDDCVAQEGRHYCLFLSRTIKNMDLMRCDSFVERD